MTQDQFDQKVETAANRFEEKVEATADRFEAEVEQSAKHLDASLNHAVSGKNRKWVSLISVVLCLACIVIGIVVSNKALSITLIALGALGLLSNGIQAIVFRK